ncbi:MAG: YeeE/YedE family protein [Calditrichae bacterium]|nr:YeeE/YedE family protein [Calditrichota bacterium]MCB9058205.1 YeeE/YedE family protein [Calditrichia bacterium]
MKNLIYAFLGTLFGIVLVKSDVVNWYRIQAMFRFEEAHMYLVFAAAIATGVLSVKLLKIRTAGKGATYNFQGKVFHKGFIIGGLIFGAGWAITGACPGPIFAQIGTGAYPALITLVGAVIGAYLYYSIKGKLPH